MKNTGKKKKTLGWVIAIAALVGVNVLASWVHFRVDLTEEKRYSLTPSTRTLLQNLNEDLSIQVFLKGDFPAEFRKLSNTTEDFLQVLKETNAANIQYRFISPLDEVAGRTWADSLTSAGVSPINLSVQVAQGQESKYIFPFALVTYKGQTALVNLFESSKKNVTRADLNAAEAAMEYNFVRAVNQLQNPTRPLVAYTTGNGQPTGPETYSLVQLLQSQYEFGIVDLAKMPVIPDTIKAILVVKPSVPFTDVQKLTLDQYVMRGGKIIWAIDNLHAEEDSLRFKEQLIAYDRNLNLQDLLFRYGVRINPDLLMDLQCDFLPFAVGGSPDNPQYEFLHWNYYPLFESRGNHPINKNLGLVAGRFVNSIDTVDVANVSKTFLLQSSANSRTISTPALISTNENRNAPEDEKFKQRNIPAAVLLEGEFTSLYKARIGRAQMDSLARYGGFRESSPENKMVVIGDGDVVLNDVSPQSGPIEMGKNLFTVGSQFEYEFANRQFLTNILEYLLSPGHLIETRNKEVILRLLNGPRVEAEKGKWQFINIGLPILLVILAGWVYQQLRRRQYAGSR
ncbi:MAG: gliding motility-associated ABC transporter substrate-binding protein GldG [Chitinophagaceae bacterium]